MRRISVVVNNRDRMLGENSRRKRINREKRRNMERGGRFYDLLAILTK